MKKFTLAGAVCIVNYDGGISGMRVKDFKEMLEEAKQRDRDSRIAYNWFMTGLDVAQQLTENQKKILFLFMEGKSQRNIALELGVSRRTVRVQLERIKKSCRPATPYISRGGQD